jgi:hypothetical protein
MAGDPFDPPLAALGSVCIIGRLNWQFKQNTENIAISLSVMRQAKV